MRKVALAAGALAMTVVAQLLFLRGHDLDSAVVLYGLAVIALAAAAWGGQEEAKPAPVWSPRVVSRLARIRGLIALAAALAAAGGAAWLLSRDWRFLYRSLFLYGVGMALATYGFSQLEGWSLPGVFVEAWRGLRRRKWEVVCLGLILAFALFLRLYRLDYYPPPGGIAWNDEAQIGKEAHEFLRGRSNPWQFPLSVYGVALAFSLLGESVLSLRLTFILFGFAMLVTFFFLARQLFDPRIALVGTFLLGISRWHISFTKLVLPSTTTAFLELLVLVFVFRGWRTKGKVNYLWAGAALGVGLYGHASFRILPVILLLLVLHRLLSALWDVISSLRKTEPRQVEGREGTSPGPLVTAIKSNMFGITAFLVSTFLFAYPYLVIVRREPTLAFMERFASTMPVVFAPEKADYLDQLIRRTREVLLYFNYRGEGWGAINLPGAPMLDPLTGVLFALGLGYAAVHFWRKRSFFLISSFLLIMITGGVLAQEFRTHRIFIVIPFVYLLVCLCLDRVWWAFRGAVRQGQEWTLALPLVVVLAVSAWYNFDTFFNHQIHAQDVRQEFLRDVAAVANYIGSLGTDSYTYLFANFPFYRPGHDFAWIAGDPPGRQGADIVDMLPSRDRTRSDLAYIFVDPYDGDTLCGVVSQVYPEAVTEVYQDDYQRYRFVTCLVPGEVVEARQGLVGHYYRGTDWSGESEVSRRDLTLAFDWRTDSPPLRPPFSVQWEGAVYAPLAGDYLFAVQSDGVSQVYLDEVSVLNSRKGQRGEGQVPLVVGWHRLSVRYATDQADGTMELSWSPPGGTWEVIPPSVLTTVAPAGGLVGRYYQGSEWAGEPVLQRLDPLVLLTCVPAVWGGRPGPALEGKPYSVVWDGWLHVDERGVYTLRAESWSGAVEVVIDGQQVLSDPGQPDHRSLANNQVRLKQGWHAIEVRYAYRQGEFSGLRLLWSPPGEDLEVVPSRVLQPPWAVISEGG